MLKIYGSWLCPDCRNAEQKLNEAKIEFEFVDITNSMANMKEFLKLRDSSAVFDEAKAEGCVGIPAFVKEDESITLDVEEIVK